MTGDTRELAMFPLGAVLFPGMPLQLQIFEPRYVEMLSSVLAESEHEFGVVLIERGSEVGGGDVRFPVGTVARIVSLEPEADSIVLLATGGARFEVVKWLQDDPFPRAEVRELSDVELGESTPSELVEAEAAVRATISRASEFVEISWPANTELSSELSERLWQVAGIAPLNAMDQYSLLRSRTAAELLVRLVEDTQAAELLLTSDWGADLDHDGHGD